MGLPALARSTGLPPLDKTRPLSQVEVAQLIRNIVQKHPKATSKKVSSPADFQSTLISELAELPTTIPSDQLHRGLRQMLQETTCGGAACSRVFGLEADDVSKIMDLAQAEMNRSQVLSDSAKLSLKERIMQSLNPSTLRGKLASLKTQIGLIRGKSTSFEGTCAIPMMQAFGLRSNPETPAAKAARDLQDGKTIDLRQNGPKKFQGKVGACHVFATAELLRHSPIKDLTISRKIDIERAFVEIWMRHLGSSLDEAIALELEASQNLNKVRRNYLSQGEREGISKIKAFNNFVRDSSYFFWLNKQAGTASFDFDHWQKFGAPLVNQGLRPLTIDDLEKMTEALALARLRIMEAETFGGDLALNYEARKDLLRDALGPIFRLGEESMRLNRSAVKKELKDIKLTERSFDSTHPTESIADFLRDLEIKAPLYIAGNQHATVIVGYDPKTNMFWVRDSDDSLGRDYVPLSADELFNSLDSYYYIARQEGAAG
jgi:hypothetical protein